MSIDRGHLRHTVLHELQSSGMLSAQPHLASAERPICECGVSLAFLQQMLLALPTGDISTECMSSVIASLTGKARNCRLALGSTYTDHAQIRGALHTVLPSPEPSAGPSDCIPMLCRLFDLINPTFIGAPTHYVIHAHGAPFQQMLTQLLTTLLGNDSVSNSSSRSDAFPLLSSAVSDAAAGPAAAASTAATAIPPSLPAAAIYVWLDIFALSQHRHQTNAQADLVFIKEVVRSCSEGAHIFRLHSSLPATSPPTILPILPTPNFCNPACTGCVVVVDAKLQVLSRSWCLYEMFCCVYENAMSQDWRKLRVSLSGKHPPSHDWQQNICYANCFPLARTLCRDLAPLPSFFYQRI